MMGFGPKQSQLEDPQSTKYLNDEEHASYKGHAKLRERMKMNFARDQNFGSAYNAIINQCFISHASWRCFFQVVALSYAKQVIKLMDSVIMAREATDEVNKELNTLKMGASLLHKTVIFIDMIRCCHPMLL